MSGLISEATIAAVLEATDLRQLVGQSVALRRQGNRWLGLCPFHQENTPSFHLLPDGKRFHCFGCQASGDALSFIRELEGLEFRDAVVHLAEAACIEVAEVERSPDERHRQAAARSHKEELFAANNVAALFFERMLLGHPLSGYAHAELERRGLSLEEHGETLKAFRVGYAPASFHELTRFLAAQGIRSSTAVSAGLIARSERSGHTFDRFRHRFIFAVHDVQGRIVGFSGRQLPNPNTGEEDKRAGKYINTPETPIYRKSETVFGLFQAKRAIRAAERAVVVEGNFDVVSLAARGFATVVAPLGTAFTAKQAELVKRYSPSCCFAFDGDAAGAAAVEKALEPCEAAGLQALAIPLPAGADPDSLVRAEGVSGLTTRLEGALPAVEMLADHALAAALTRGSESERLEVVQEVRALLQKVRSPVVRRILELKLSRKLTQALGGQLSSGAWSHAPDRQTFKAIGRHVRQALNVGTNPEAHAAPIESPEEILVGAILDVPTALDDEQLQKGTKHLEGEPCFVIAAIQRVRRSGLPLRAAELLAEYPLEHPWPEFIRARLAAPRFSDAEAALEAAAEALWRMRCRGLARASVPASGHAAVSAQPTAPATGLSVYPMECNSGMYIGDHYAQGG